MPNKTTNFGLIKPLPEEFYDIEVHNSNMDKIDSELKKTVPYLATYYPVSTAKSADELTDPFALVPVSTEINPDLFEVVGGTYAWVWTNFYINVTVTSRRMQIAMSYNTIDHKMAFRIYGANGWLEWKEIATTDNIQTNIPITSGIPSDSEIWIDPNDGTEIWTAEQIGAVSTNAGEENEGKFLRVVNGIATWTTINSAEGGSF